MEKWEAQEKRINNDEYDKILSHQFDEYNKPILEKVHFIKADKL